MKLVNLIGTRFGRLTVTEETERTRAPNGESVRWLKCVCDCGKEKTVRVKSLRSGCTTSCGCFKVDQTRERVQLPPGERGLNRLYRNYQGAARSRGLSFSITREEFAEITRSNCFYCGATPAQLITGMGTRLTEQGKKNGLWIYNGIDRVDSQLGYELNNVVPCCGVCNKVKLDHSIEFLFAHLKKMLEVFESRQKQEAA